MFSIFVNRLYCKDFMICTAAVIFLFVHFLQESYRRRLTSCPKYCIYCYCCITGIRLNRLPVDHLWYEVAGDNVYKVAKMNTRCSFWCNFSCDIYIVLIHILQICISYCHSTLPSVQRNLKTYLKLCGDFFISLSYVLIHHTLHGTCPREDVPVQHFNW